MKLKIMVLLNKCSKVFNQNQCISYINQDFQY